MLLLGAGVSFLSVLPVGSLYELRFKLGWSEHRKAKVALVRNLFEISSERSSC